MDSSDVVIIGGVACGPKTGAVLARRRPDLKITLFQKEELTSYATCGLPYYASGDVNAIDDLIKTSYGVMRDREFFHKTKGFTVVTGAEVAGIRREKKCVIVKDVETGETIEHGYGKLVIAVGARPNNPPFSVPDAANVRPFTKPQDAIAFRTLAEQGKIDHAVVSGGCLVGCEADEAAVGMWGINVTMIEKEPHVLPWVLDWEMAEIVHRELARQKVNVIHGASVRKIEVDGEGRAVVQVAGQDAITCDYVFLGLGVHPNNDLAGQCGLQLGSTGAISVNPRLQTSDPDIYAGGDCVESRNIITGWPMYLPMGSVANRHGRVIAENLAGGAGEFNGVVGAFYVKVFDMNVGAVGLSRRGAEAAGVEVAELWGSFVDRPDYYPESKSMTLKMLYAPTDGRLLGLQAVGTGDICRRIDVFSTFLSRRAAVADLFEFEAGYAPPYAEALDPLHHLAAMAQAQRRGLRFLSPGTDFSQDDRKLQIVDIREVDEAQSVPCNLKGYPGTGSINIPLGELRARLDELDKDLPTVVVCRRGPRSYQGALILKAAWFDDVSVFAGGLQSQE